MNCGCGIQFLEVFVILFSAFESIYVIIVDSKVQKAIQKTSSGEVFLSTPNIISVKQIFLTC